MWRRQDRRRNFNWDVLLKVGRAAVMARWTVFFRAVPADLDDHVAFWAVTGWAVTGWAVTCAAQVAHRSAVVASQAVDGAARGG